MIVYVPILYYDSSLQEYIVGVYDSEYKATIAMNEALEEHNRTIAIEYEQKGEVRKFEVK